MPSARALLVAAVTTFAAPATAQLGTRSIALESGASLDAEGGRGAGATFAVATTTWLDGPADALLRVGVSSAPQTPGRPPARTISGTVGLRLSLLPDPLRPQLTLEVGWARRWREGAEEDRLALAAGAGVEWFPARDLSVSSRATLRWVGPSAGAELLLAATAYF